MRNRFDQFTKSIFREALTPAGTVYTQDEVSAEVQAIDTRFEPDPARIHALKGLGWLGEMARIPSLFEAFHNTVDLREYRSCVRKQLTLDHQETNRALKALKKEEKVALPPFPYAWVLSSGRPDRVIDDYEFKPMGGWPAGFLGRTRGDAVGLVVVRELPRVRETLLLRLAGAGEVLEEALAELARLPEDAREQAVALTSLVAFRQKISHDSSREERAFLMSTEPLYDQWEKQIKDQGREEGLDVGRGMLLDLLRTRFGALPKAAVARVNAADAGQLGRWTRKVLDAKTLDEVFRGG